MVWSLIQFTKVGSVDLISLRCDVVTDKVIVPMGNKDQFISAFDEVEVWAKVHGDKLRSKPEVEGVATIIEAFRLAFEDGDPGEADEEDDA